MMNIIKSWLYARRYRRWAKKLYDFDIRHLPLNVFAHKYGHLKW